MCSRWFCRVGCFRSCVLCSFGCLRRASTGVSVCVACVCSCLCVSVSIRALFATPSNAVVADVVSFLFCCRRLSLSTPRRRCARRSPPSTKPSTARTWRGWRRKSKQHWQRRRRKSRSSRRRRNKHTKPKKKPKSRRPRPRRCALLIFLFFFVFLNLVV